jgi:hypothetical protein
VVLTVPGSGDRDGLKTAMLKIQGPSSCHGECRGFFVLNPVAFATKPHIYTKNDVPDPTI